MTGGYRHYKMAGGYRHYKNDEDTDTIKWLEVTGIVHMTGGYGHYTNDLRIQTL